MDHGQRRRAGRVARSLDIDTYLRHLVMENIMVHGDGYSYRANNYRVYYDPDEIDPDEVADDDHVDPSQSTFLNPEIRYLRREGDLARTLAIRDRRRRTAIDLDLAGGRHQVAEPLPAQSVLDAFTGLQRRAEDARVVVRLEALEGVAELIGRPKGSIGPTRARCLAKLRALLERL